MKPELKYLLWSKLILGMLTGFLLIGLPLYLLDLKLEISDIGLMFGTAMLFYAAISFYLGSYSESFGRLWIGIISIIGMAASSILFGVMSFLAVGAALVVFVAGKILFSLSESVFRNITKIRILDLADSDQLGSGYGLLIFADGLGYGLGILLGGIIISAVSFQFVFLELAALSFFSLIFYAKTGDIQKKSEREKILRISNLTGTPMVFKIVLLLNTILLFGVYLVDFFGLPLFQKEVLKMSNEQIFLLIGIAWLFYAVFSYIGGKLYDRYGLKIFITAVILISITSVLMAFTKNIILFSLLLIIDYIFFSFADPARSALIGFVSKEKKGMLMSFFEFFSIVAAAIVMLFFGKLVDFFSFEFMFILRGISQLAAISLVLVIYRKIADEKNANYSN